MSTAEQPSGEFPALARATRDVIPIRPTPVDRVEIPIPPGVKALQIERYPDGTAARIVGLGPRESIRVIADRGTPVLYRFLI